MKKIDLAKDTEYLDSILIGLLVGRFYVSVRNRNAWHSTTSSQYQGVASLSSDIETAKEVAETWRKQGSQFLIKEVPGIAVLTPIGLAVAVDFQHDNAFGNWDARAGKENLKRGARVGDLLHSLGQHGDWQVLPNPDSIVQGFEPFGVIQPVGQRASFRTYTSRSDGPEYLLRWRSGDAPRVNARGAHRIRRAFLTVNGPDSVKSGQEEYLAAKNKRRDEMFARFRERAAARGLEETDTGR